jgi:hypothetical protein
LDFFSGRRKRESAASAQAEAQEFSGISRSHDESVPEGSIQIPNGMQGNGTLELQGIGDLGNLGALIGTALAQGNVSVSGQSQVIDLRGTGLREQMVEALEAHGIDVESQQGQQIDAGSIPGLGPEVLGLLSQAGVDLDGDGVPDNMQQPRPSSPDNPD